MPLREGNISMTLGIEPPGRKNSQLWSSLTFSCHCRDEKKIPKLLKTKRNIRTARTNRIYSRTEKALLRERIHDTIKSLDKIDKLLLNTFYHSSYNMQRADWDKIDATDQWKIIWSKK